MNNIKKILILIISIFIITLNQSASYSITMKALYILYNKQPTELSEVINEYLTIRKIVLYKADFQNNFFYYQPSYKNKFYKGDYLSVLVHSIGNDSYLYIQNNFSAFQESLDILDYLKKKNYNCVEINNPKFINGFFQVTSNLIAPEPIDLPTIIPVQLNQTTVLKQDKQDQPVCFNKKNQNNFK